MKVPGLSLECLLDFVAGRRRLHSQSGIVATRILITRHLIFGALQRNDNSPLRAPPTTIQAQNLDITRYGARLPGFSRTKRTQPAMLRAEQCRLNVRLEVR